LLVNARKRSARGSWDWTGDKPHSLGLLRAVRTVTITIPAALIPHTTSNAALAVSLEPPGGSPTGPVIGRGKLTTL
jgi:anti-sigma-K factor RskA